VAKIANRYFKIDPWNIIEQGFGPSHKRVAESVFTLANEFMGVRGYFEEGYSGDGLQGSYFNQLFEEAQVSHPQAFKGMINRSCFMVNSVDWLYTRIWLNEELLDLANSKISDFVQNLNMKQGILSRRFVWETSDGKMLEMKFERFLSLVDIESGWQRIVVKPINFDADIKVRVGLDFSIKHELADGWDQTFANKGVKGKCFWNVLKEEYKNGWISVLGKTISSNHILFSAINVSCDSINGISPFNEENIAGQDLVISLTKSKETIIERKSVSCWSREQDEEQVWTKGKEKIQCLNASDYTDALKAHVLRWKDFWVLYDIEIEGDPELQQGLRFSLFQMYQNYRGVSEYRNMGCKGLTGEVYDGQTFWDSETYVPPFFIYHEPEAAKNLLLYRYHQLPQAIERAEQMDCVGARYPFTTIDGTESCGTWQHGDFEIHVSVGIAYAIWRYVKITNDKEFLFKEGIEMLLQICRYYASRGGFNPRTGEFGLYGVMGPDEYHMNVNNNFYTNAMVRKAFEFTLQLVDEMQNAAADSLHLVRGKIQLLDFELKDWHVKAEKMRLPVDSETGIFEQHDGYFDLPEVDIQSISDDEIPIYKNWAYLRILRNNMIKQPDVLLIPLFYSNDYSLETKLANYEFYEKRCIHESSLSPSIHSIYAVELGRLEDAYQFFKYAARLDLDDYNKNTEQGLHVTSMSGAWLNMIYGFAGLRDDTEIIQLSPSIPGRWKSYKFRLNYRGSLFEVSVDGDFTSFQLINGDPIKIKIYDQIRQIDLEPLKISAGTSS
jgi:maltose phosphorylase